MNEKITISGAEASEQIIKKLLGEVEENYHPGPVDPFKVLLHERNFNEKYWGNSYLSIEAFCLFVGCDIALELKGKKLWAWSIKVIRDRKTNPPLEDRDSSSLSSPVIYPCQAEGVAA